MKINAWDWAGDLGTSKYAGWERVGGETHGQETAAEAKAMQQEEVAQHEKKADNKPIEITVNDVADSAAVEPTTDESDAPPASSAPTGRRGRRR